MHLHIDFETFSLLDLRKTGADVYARHFSTDAWCMAYAFDDEPAAIWKKGARLPKRISEHVASGGIVFAHNAAFELALWNYTMTKKHGWPPLSVNQTRCSMVRCYAMQLPGALENAAPALGLKYEKDMKGHRVMLQLCRPRKIDENCPYCAGEGIAYNDASKKINPHQCECTCFYSPESDEPGVREKFEKLYAYCKQDIEVERELLKRLLSLSADEEEVWRLDQKINSRGLCVDSESVAAAVEIVELEKKRLDAEMRKVTGNQVATCTAHTQLKNWLSNVLGIAIIGVAKAEVTELLSRSDLPSIARQALLLRQEAAKSSTAKLNPLLHSVCEDGRIRGLFQYHGAGATGRWAGRRLQPQNFPRPSILHSASEVDSVFKILGGGL